MRLIAQKPCSFGGNKFFIGEEVPTELVTNPKMQEKMGVTTLRQITQKQYPIKEALRE